MISLNVSRPVCFVFLVFVSGISPRIVAEELPFKSVHELRALPNDENLHLEARTSGVINHISNNQTEIAIQDGNSALWSLMHVNRARDLKLGQQVTIGGYLQKGKFAPDFVVKTLDVTGEPGLPEPENVTGSELLNGAYDCRFVKLTGIVRAIVPWSG